MTHADPTRIVVGIDGSISSIDALRRAAVIASRLDAPIEVITTWQYPTMISGYYPPADWSPEDDARQIEASTIKQAFPQGAPSNLTAVTIEGSTANVLIDESAGAFMLVVGSRGHSGVAGLLLGSVSAACAERAHCPVLIMHEVPLTAVQRDTRTPASIPVA